MRQCLSVCLFVQELDYAKSFQAISTKTCSIMEWDFSCGKNNFNFGVDHRQNGTYTSIVHTLVYVVHLDIGLSKF